MVHRGFLYYGQGALGVWGSNWTSPLSTMREISGPFLRLTMESQNRPYLAVLPAGHSSAAQELLKMKRGATGLAPSVLGSGKNRPQRKDFLDNRDEKFCKGTDWDVIATIWTRNDTDCLSSLEALWTFLSCSAEILSGPWASHVPARSRRGRRMQGREGRDVAMVVSRPAVSACRQQPAV